MEIIPKRPWSKGDPERRSARRLASDLMKIQREHERNIRIIEKKHEYSAFVLAVCILVAFLLMCAFARGCHAYTDQEAIKAVIGEAEGEGFKGMLAVAGAIRNRGTLKGVYGLHAQRVLTHKYSKMTYKQATRAWNDSKHMDISKGAKYWEGTRFPLPYWAKNMTVTAIIGNQRFFRN